MAVLQKLCFLALVGSSLSAHLRNSTANVLRGASNATAPPCQCQAANPAWVATTRTVPKCIFIDLGAADGNSFNEFLNNAYGPVANCPSGQWEALLVEANPQFTPALTAVAAQHPGMVHTYGSTAAYMCQGQTSFSIDPDAANNHWGSSMKTTHGSTQVTVPTVNVVQLIAENVAQGDWVILKVDIEGAEYDLIPCLAQYPNKGLLDIIFMEEHKWLQGNAVYSRPQFDSALATLRNTGISIPENYHSGTF